MDPSYELDSDYAQVVDATSSALRRFSSCVVMVWYPILSRPGREGTSLWDSTRRRLREATVERGAPKGWLDASIYHGKTKEGLIGSGIFIANPPYTLAQSVGDLLLYLSLNYPSMVDPGYVIETSETVVKNTQPA